MNGSFYATWKPKENYPNLDPEGRLLDGTVLKNLSARIEGQSGKISFKEQKKGESQPRLPYSLSSLQIEAGKKYGYSPQQVLDAQQSLYEKKLTSYPRSDCEYLPENQFVDGSTILCHLKNISEEFSALVGGADNNLKSRCWNDKKISAHHAIIPTAVAADLSSLTEVEKNLYVLVAKAYITQFYPNQQFLTTKIEVLCAGEIFSTSGRVIIREGWQKIYHGEQEEKEEKEENAKLPSMGKGDDVSQGTHEILEKVTKPPKRFTPATLVQAMKEIGKYVKDKTLQPILKNCSGIGTEATRAGIIETLQKREYVTLVKKELHPTEKAYMLVNVLPESFTYPDVTAQWETALEAISKNEMEYFTFAEKQKSFIQQLFQDAAMVQIASPANVIKCPKCGKPLVRRKSTKGFFWGCSGYPDCKTIFSDQKGKPVLSHK